MWRVLGTSVKGCLAFVILTLSLVACSTNPPSASEEGGDAPAGDSDGSPVAQESGVEGLVLLGPTCPAVQSGTQCPDRPFEADLTILDLDGEEVARGKSEADGIFRIPLPPGEYVLAPEQPFPDLPPFARPIEFEVKPGEYVQLDIRYDSGVR